MDPLPFGLLDDEMLRDVSNFVGGHVTSSGTSYSSVISTYNTRDLCFRVELKRRGTRVEEVLSHTYVAEISALQVVRMLVACPTWTHAQFVFRDDGLDDLVLEIFSLLRSSRSLSTLDIQLDPLDYRHLLTLLYGNLFLETLILNPGLTKHRKDAESIALCFSRNCVLKSCTLVVNSTLDFQTWEIALSPFTTGGNVTLKELAVHGTNPYALEAIVNVVRCDTMLEKLEIRSNFEYRMFLSGGHRKSLATALAADRTLKELSCDCSVESLKELVSVFIPDSSGHQANTHLRTLTLVPNLDFPDYPGLEDFMKELARILEFNTTLKHIKVVLGGDDNSSKIWEVRSSMPPRHREVCTKDMLEAMISNELRVNTSLQSLVVGSWKLRRAGGEWQMSYGGPCLARELPTAEYDVTVTMRQ